jgi:NAD(P)H-dependent FMN reductase
MSNILAFSGSTRSGSFNKKILNAAVCGATEAGATVTVIDLADYKLPLYDGDLEALEGIPENGKKLKELFMAHQGLLFALPEYNSSISGVFKNVIDWVSRPTENETEPLACFKNKTAAIISASPGNLGGMRGLVHARSLLENINVLVLPQQVCVPNADTAFDDKDVLKDDKTKLSLEKLGHCLAGLIDKINAIEKDKGLDILPPNHHKKTIKEQVQDFENEGNNPGNQQ